MEACSGSVEVEQVFRDWHQDADGVWTRRAARTIVLGPATWILLLRGFDVEDPSRTWWFTPGGGLQPDESDRRAAARELLEETGLRVPLHDLVGPVAARTAAFSYFGRSCRQHEVLFLTQLTDDKDLTTSGWTAVERASVSELRWWNLDELASTTQSVYPPSLSDLVRVLVDQGWDGTTHVIQ